MAMRGEITALKLRDESLGKTILDIWLSWMDRKGRKSWSIGISGTEGEVDEWANRNRAYSRGEGAPNAKMGE
jgi:hypothetical protein